MVGKITKVAVAAAFVLTVAGAAPATAKAGDVITSGACSATSVWKLKLSPQNAGIQGEFEVDSNVVGQTWRLKIQQNGQTIFTGTRVTKAPSGSFTVRGVATDTAGADAFTAQARNPATGETCPGQASI
jgi:hypothetical protein